MSAPYYSDDLVTLYHGDCREVGAWLEADALVTDPPYPNNAGHFDDAVPIAREVIAAWTRTALIFWNECEFPPYGAPPVAVHIWHRTNVNGRPYEPVFHFAPDGIKRRSLVFRHAAINEGATGSTDTRSVVWSAGHPTQKPTGVMESLISLTSGVVADPFAGSGSTIVAAKNLGRRAIGVEADERYCEIAANRLTQDTLFGELIAAESVAHDQDTGWHRHANGVVHRDDSGCTWLNDPVACEPPPRGDA